MAAKDVVYRELYFMRICQVIGHGTLNKQPNCQRELPSRPLVGITVAYQFC